jgi:hypothetical protein
MTREQKAEKRGKRITNKRAAKKSSTDEMPLEHILKVMRNENKPEKMRLDAAKVALPYMHPRLSTVEHSGKDGVSIEVTIAGDDADLL